MSLISPHPAGISAGSRDHLARLNRAFRGPFTPAEAAEVLDVDASNAADLLGHLARKGWLARIRRGLYATVPLEATEPRDWRVDAWLIAAHVFAPCYVAGWSACEHWELTDQLFRSTAVISGTPQRRSKVTVHGSAFVVAHRASDVFFGTRPVWRDGERVDVSDPPRTIVDVLDDPVLGGGIRHVAEVLETYFGGEHRDDDRLVDYADRLGNRTVFKRLGYLLEALEIHAPDLIAQCLERRSAGVSKLDPSVRETGRITSRWGLRVNSTVRSNATA